MTDTKAVCWELGTTNNTKLGLRILLAGQYVGTQELSADNARPRWKFQTYYSAHAATAAAVTATERFESEQHGTLVVPPGEIILHPSEVAAMGSGRPISPALRARIFTSLQRRDPRVGGVLVAPVAP
jgi:hypothetical protein